MIDYVISTFKSKYTAYHNKKYPDGTVKLYISKIWEYSKDFEDFLEGINFFILLERICLERGLQKIKLKNRCKPINSFNCKMEKIAWNMTVLLRNDMGGLFNE
jgi:hypothetical protein